MDLFGYGFQIENRLGLFSFISLIFLLLLYLFRPKPFKKVIPSLIFLEKSEKRLTLVNFFKKFVKDWLIFLQLFILVFLCLSTLGMTTELVFQRLNREVVFVIDASASSSASYAGKPLIEHYKDAARQRIGIFNSIVLAKNAPEISLKKGDPINAFSAITSLRATDSLSNIWDAMIAASEIGGPNSLIVVLSDFADTQGKDLSVAMGLLEAKGFRVEMVDLSQDNLKNAGIIAAVQEGDKAIIDIKNFNSYPSEAYVKNLDRHILIPANMVERVEIGLKEGINTFEIDSGDSLKADDKIRIIMPKKAKSDAIILTNRKTSYLRAALESISQLNVKKAEPPIVSLSEEQLIVLDNVDYNSLLPGTIERIKEKVLQGSSLIISAQDNLDTEKLGDLLPVEITGTEKQDVEIVNAVTLDTLRNFDFGMSSRYNLAYLRGNSSIVIAEAADKSASPVVVLSKYGKGNVLYYGIYDDYNQFKISSQYPLFWIAITGLLTEKDDYSRLNLKIGDIVYGKEIKDPEGKRYSDYAILDKVGIYNVDGKDISSNLLSAVESDINKKAYSANSAAESQASRGRGIKQSLSLLGIFVVSAISLSLLEIFFLKKRGDL